MLVIRLAAAFCLAIASKPAVFAAFGACGNEPAGLIAGGVFGVRAMLIGCVLACDFAGVSIPAILTGVAFGKRAFQSQTAVLGAGDDGCFAAMVRLFACLAAIRVPIASCAYGAMPAFCFAFAGVMVNGCVAVELVCCAMLGCGWGRTSFAAGIAIPAIDAAVAACDVACGREFAGGIAITGGRCECSIGAVVVRAVLAG